MPSARKILLTGAGGLLGSQFAQMIPQEISNYHISPKTHRELDITRRQEIEKILEAESPHFLINCAAFTQVDDAEKNPLAMTINRDGPQFLAEACLKRGIKLVHYSTDFVFDGKKGSPYRESDGPSPINQYGVTKWEGEKSIEATLPKDQYLILRISWPYGKTGKNFIHTLWELSKTRPELRVVDDQVGVPNPAHLIARKTLEVMEKASGLLHLSCRGYCSRYDLIRFLLDALHSPCRVIPVSSEEFPLPARRPAFSALETEYEDWKTLLNMPTWQEALLQYLKSPEWT